MATKTNKTGQLKTSKASQTLYISLRQKLDDLGYSQLLSNDSAPLVEHLLNDLLRARESYSAVKRLNDQQSQEIKQLKQETSKLENIEQFERRARFLEETLLNERRTTTHRLQDIQIENSKLLDLISDLRFASEQNARIIDDLKQENDSKARLILKLQNGIPSKEDNHGPAIEKDKDLPAADLSKIQSLYKRILSAADNPAIIDWVAAAESKMTCMDRDLVNLRRALEVSQRACDDYRRQVADYERKMAKLGHSKPCQEAAKLRSRAEKLERENKDLQMQLTDSVRKQHEAMSRAIMLAGGNRPTCNRPDNGRVEQQLTQLEKKAAALEGERDMMKHMLNSTQKERDDLMRDVQRLHSQEAALMSEIRSLVEKNPESGSGSARSATGKSVRFQPSRLGDSGVESVASDSVDEDGESNRRARESWLRRLTEQRQQYYDNVQELLNFMKNRRDDSARTQPQYQPLPQNYSAQLEDQRQRLANPRREQRATQTDTNRDQASQTNGGKEPSAPAEDSGIPRQFQTWARSLQEERKTLKEQNDALRLRVQQLTEQVLGLEGRIQDVCNKLRNAEQNGIRLERELEASHSKLVTSERELTQERARNQQLRLNLEEMDSNAANLNKKLSEKTNAADGARQRCTELEIQLAKLEEQFGGLQGQIRSHQVNRSQLETEKRHLQDEMDSYKARIGQLEKQIGIKQDTINTQLANIQSYQGTIQQLEEDTANLRSQLDLSRRQNQQLTQDFDKGEGENTALRRENERLVASMSSLKVEVDRERQAAQDLRREMQTYVSRVRQVEGVLARKDEERDSMIKQLQQLANETCSFDAEREKMDRTLRGHQQEASSLHQELNTVRRRLSELEQLYNQQKNSNADASHQTEELVRRLASLEHDLRDTREDKIRLEQQLMGAQEMQHRLEKQLENLRTEAAHTDTQTHAMGLETSRMQEDIHTLEERLAQERNSARSLETTVTILRQERAQQDDQLRNVSQDLSRLQQREILLQEELANSKAELCSNEGKLADLSRELQRLKQELLQEKFDRERTRQELKRMSNVSHTPPPPLSPSFCSTARSVTLPPTLASLSGQSPSRRRPVADRLMNSATQTQN